MKNICLTVKNAFWLTKTGGLRWKQILVVMILDIFCDYELAFNGNYELVFIIGVFFPTLVTNKGNNDNKKM